MPSRRSFLSAGLAAIAARALAQTPSAAEPVIDIHQHMNYHKRADEHLLAHQKAMGITTTIILPAGTYLDRPSTHNGKSNGLD